MHLRHPILLLAAFAALACEEPAPADAGADGGVDAEVPRCEGGLDAGEPSGGIMRGCAQGVVSSGFGLRLDGPAGLPMARWGAQLRLEAPEICPPGVGLSGVTLVTDVDARGGGAIARASYAVLGEGAVGGRPDAGGGTIVRVERGRVSLEPSAESPVVSAPALFDLAAVGFDGAGAIAVVLDGFEIDTDIPQPAGYPDAYDPGDGYAIRALGASVGDATIEGTDLSFTVGARLELGRSGEADMDRAAAAARARVTVRYAVVALAEAPAVEHVAYDVECRPGADVGVASFDLAPDARAVPALTAFSVEVGPDVEGTFVRELAVLLDGLAIDGGRATVRLEAFLEGPSAATLPQHVEADVALLTWRGGDDVERLRYAEPVGTGIVETELPLAP